MNIYQFLGDIDNLHWSRRILTTIYDGADKKKVITDKFKVKRAWEGCYGVMSYMMVTSPAVYRKMIGKAYALEHGIRHEGKNVIVDATFPDALMVIPANTNEQITVIKDV